MTRQLLRIALRCVEQGSAQRLVFFALACAALGAAGCNGEVDDADTRAARARYVRASNDAIRGRDVCREVHARPASDALAKKRSLDPRVGFGKLAVKPAGALCVDVASGGFGAKLVDCSTMPKTLFDSLALTAMPPPCTPTVAEAEAMLRFVETSPRKKEKADWLTRVDDAAAKLSALGKATAPTKAPAYVVTECKSPMFSADLYAGQAHPTGYKPTSSAAQFDCDLTVFWIDDAGTVTAFAHGYGSRKTYGAPSETTDSLDAKNAASRSEAIAAATSDLVADVARRR